MLSKETGEFGGAGLSLWIAIPISFVVALGIGLHQRMAGREDPAAELHDHARHVLRVDRRQARLLEADRRPDPGRRHQRCRRIRVLDQIFASEWNRNDARVRQPRQGLPVCLLLAIALIVVAVVEMQFSRRRDAVKPAGLACSSSAPPSRRRHRRRCTPPTASAATGSAARSSPSVTWSACYG